MDKRVLAEFERQEKEDQFRLTNRLEDSVNEEFGNAEYLIGKMQDDLRYRPEDILEFSINESLIRVSAEFSIRKHTSCLLPYYHSHDFYEIIYVWQGTGRQMIPGSSSRMDMRSGELCILTPGMVHMMLPCEAGDIILKMIIPVSLMRKLLLHMEKQRDEDEEDSDRLPAILREKNKIYIFQNMAETGYMMKRLMDDLLHETYWGTTYRMLAVESLLQLLFITLGRHDIIGKYSHENCAGGIFQEVSSYIRENIRTANFEELAGRTGYSGRHLRRRIADSTGGTFSDILQRIRAEEAASLLNGTDKPVEEIAALVGYHSTSGFYKRFLQAFHMTPAAYRKLHEISRM